MFNFVTAGAEAVEGCVKYARKYQHSIGQAQRYRVITFDGSFHGRTLATIAAAKGKKLVEGFGPEVDGFDLVPFGNLNAVRTRSEMKRPRSWLSRYKARAAYARLI